MVETEKVCNHKISTASTTCELVQRTKSVGESGGRGDVNGGRGGSGGGRRGGGGKVENGYGYGGGGATLARSNTICTGNKGSSSVGSNSAVGGGGDGGKGQRPSLERSMSAYYVFSSLPQVVHNVRPKTGYRNNVSRPRGAHDYFNVMWDPHIYRGTTTTLTSSLKQPDTTAGPATDLTTSRDQQDRYRRRRAFLQGSQNTFNNSTSNNNLAPIGGGIGGATNSSQTIRSNRYRMTTKVSSRSKTFPPPEGRHQVHVQTEEYLEDLTRDVIKGPEVDAIVQTDPIEDEELLSSPLVDTSQNGEGGNRLGGGGKGGGAKGKRLPVGVDASTQVLPGELITFDERVQPVVEAVVGKILEQSLLETMEEEEIGALKAQQNRFLEKRKEEERELKRLQEQQERISAEKERLKRHLELQIKQRQLQQNGGGVDGGEGNGVEGGDDSVLLTDQLGIGGNNNGMLSTAYLLELLPSVLNSLRQEGFLLEDDVLSSYVPLWQQQQQSSTSSKPEDDDDDDDENMTNNINENNNKNDDLIMMSVENGEDNFSSFPDGYLSRMNSLEIAAAGSQPIQSSFLELQDALTSAFVEDVTEEENENEEKAPVVDEETEIRPEENEGDDDVGGDGEELKMEEDDTKMEETTGENGDEMDGDGDGASAIEGVEEQEEKAVTPMEDEGGENSEILEESIENEAEVEEPVVAEKEGEGEEEDLESVVITPTEKENEDLVEEEGQEEETNEIGEEKDEETGKEEVTVTEEEDIIEIPATEENPDEDNPPQPTSSSSSSSQKLPNGAIPSVL